MAFPRRSGIFSCGRDLTRKLCNHRKGPHMRRGRWWSPGRRCYLPQEVSFLGWHTGTPGLQGPALWIAVKWSQIGTKALINNPDLVSIENVDILIIMYFYILSCFKKYCIKILFTWFMGDFWYPHKCLSQTSASFTLLLALLWIALHLETSDTYHHAYSAWAKGWLNSRCKCWTKELKKRICFPESKMCLSYCILPLTDYFLARLLNLSVPQFYPSQ